MLRLRPYVDADWEAVLDICLLAFAPACESLERLPGTQGSVVGVVHYEVDADTQRGRIGVSAVHPARQGKGIGTLIKCLVTPEPADGGQERRAVGNERAAARPARSRNSSGSRGGPPRR